MRRVNAAHSSGSPILCLLTFLANADSRERIQRSVDILGVATINLCRSTQGKYLNVGATFNILVEYMYLFFYKVVYISCSKSLDLCLHVVVSCLYWLTQRNTFFQPLISDIFKRTLPCTESPLPRSNQDQLIKSCATELSQGGGKWNASARENVNWLKVNFKLFKTWSSTYSDIESNLTISRWTGSRMKRWGLLSEPPPKSKFS